MSDLAFFANWLATLIRSCRAAAISAMHQFTCYKRLLCDCNWGVQITDTLIYN